MIYKTFGSYINNNKIKLDEVKKNVERKISEEDFYKALNMLLTSDDIYWRGYMTPFDYEGNSFGISYKIFDAPKDLNKNDFLVHYTSSFHESQFSKRNHGPVNHIYVVDKDKKNTPILIYYDLQ